jgi:hypothetical protein
MGGLILVALGFPIGDPIAGFAVTLLIVEVPFEVTRDVLHHPSTTWRNLGRPDRCPDLDRGRVTRNPGMVGEVRVTGLA